MAAPPPARTQRRRGDQQPLFCPCGSGSPSLAGLCPRCYRARAHSRSYFAGYREMVLARDRFRCRVCGAARGRLHVHHRTPGLSHPDRLLTVCAACHARLHRLLTLRRPVPEALAQLWEEQHPGAPVQLPLPFLAMASPLGGVL